MTDSQDAQAVATRVGQNYVHLVPGAWAATLAANGRSVCAVRPLGGGQYEAVCNTTKAVVTFAASEESEVVARRLWSIAKDAG